MKRLIKYVLGLYKKYVLILIYNNKIDLTSSIHNTALLNSTQIGSYTYIGPNVVINYTIIGNYCSIAPNVIIGGMEHNYNSSSTSTYINEYIKLSYTEISDDVWIGAGSYIKAGIKIGKGAIIGANSTVLTDVPEMTIYVGSPAKFLKNRFENSNAIQEYKKLNFSLTPHNFKKNNINF